jgi:predicted amino acid-binding ACT domain protein
LRPQLEEVGRRMGLFVHLEPSVEVRAEDEPNGFVFAAGPNRVGIVAALSKTLAEHGANITEMSTRLLERTEVPVYLVRIEATIPADRWEALERTLAVVGCGLGTEVRLESLERADL